MRLVKAFRQGDKPNFEYHAKRLLEIMPVLPALSTAREMAKKMMCGANLRQQGVALQMYSNDYNGSVIHPYKPGWSVSWMVVLGPYLGYPPHDWVNSPNSYWNRPILKPLVCPSHGVIGKFSGLNAFSHAWYLANNHAVYNMRGDNNPPPTDWRKNYPNIHKLSEQSQPSKTCAFMDTWWPSSTSFDLYSPQTIIMEEWAFRWYKHLGTLNMVYIDGHVGSWEFPIVQPPVPSVNRLPWRMTD